VIVAKPLLKTLTTPSLSIFRSFQNIEFSNPILNLVCKDKINLVNVQNKTNKINQAAK
jgi:hypothetical protein